MSRGGRSPGAAGRVAPAQFPPPVDLEREFIKRSLDAEAVEVGVAIIGGGTAGLSCANRFLQLLAGDPAMRESLGEVPVAVIEKARACGGQSLSGAVIRPEALLELFPDLTRTDWRTEGFAFGEVERDAVYLLPSPTRRVRIPTPGPLRNRGNEVISVAALARFQQREAEASGAYVLTETAASQLIVFDGRVEGVRSGEKGRGRDGLPRANFEPGSDIKARVTVLAEGCSGQLTDTAIREFGLAARSEPQVFELGVKEVWRVRRPLDRVIHTIGPWPLELSPRNAQTGGGWVYPMKDARTGGDLVSVGFVVDLDYADATTSAHDLLQTLKQHPLLRDILEGGERLAWGAKALPGGGYWSLPRLSMPGALIVGDAGGLVDTLALKGVHHAITSGRLAAEAIYAELSGGESAAASYPRALERTSTMGELYRARNARQTFRLGLLAGAPLAATMIASRGRFPGGRWPWAADDSRPMFIGRTRESYPRADGRYTFDKLSSVFLSANRSGGTGPSNIRVARRVPRAIAETWRWMCPAGVYEIPADAPSAGIVDVIVNYENCVQCGAISAKGGRLTVPEGGSGPLYNIT